MHDVVSKNRQLNLNANTINELYKSQNVTDDGGKRCKTSDGSSRWSVKSSTPRVEMIGGYKQCKNGNGSYNIAGQNDGNNNDSDDDDDDDENGKVGLQRLQYTREREMICKFKKREKSKYSSSNAM